MKTPPFALVFAVAVTSSLSAATAPVLWSQHCARCHGQDGKGDTKMGHKLYVSDLTDANLQAKFSDEEATNAIKFGLKDAKGRVIMKAVRGLSDEEVKALVAHVRAMRK